MTDIRTQLGDIGKLPPQAIDVEQSVLGAVLQTDNAITIVSELLQPDSFYKMEHSKIYSAMLSLSEKGKEIDLLTIVESLNKSGELSMIGGASYISSLTSDASVLSSLEEHCYILKEKQMARMQIQFGSDLIKRAYNNTIDVFETNEFMADEVYQIQHIGDVKKDINNEDLAKQLVASIEHASKSQGITGVPTGFKEHDKLLGGFQPGNLIVLAGRPGMGKTALALCYTLHMILNQKTVIFFSCEMSGKELFQRFASMFMDINADKFKEGTLTDEDWVVFNSKLSYLLTDHLIIVDDCYTSTEMRNRTKKERMTKEIDCIMVDYIQFMTGKGQTREQEISKISRDLKMLAKEIQVPVIALSQLSRKVDERGDKRPRLSDLRESGAIEQDADVVEFLYRPKYYDEDADDTSYLCIAKHRNGALKDIKLIYQHNRTKFIDYDSYDPTKDDMPF